MGNPAFLPHREPTRKSLYSLKFLLYRLNCGLDDAQMNFVSIMAHQDDEMRCLGTMLKCRARGDRLAFVTLTDGSGGFVHQPDIARTDAARIRHEEMSVLAES